MTEDFNPQKSMQASIDVAEKNISLTSKQVGDAMSAILSGQIETSMIERWLRLLSQHIPTSAEIFGGVQALLQTTTLIQTNIACEKIIDTAGTGGAPKLRLKIF